MGQAMWTSLYVTLTRKGVINLNRTTFEKMGEPEAVHVYFDETNNRFGIKPTPRSMRDAFPLGKRGSRGGRRIFVGSVLRTYRIDLPDTIQFFDADFDDEGLLVLDLRTARVPTRVLNHRAKRVSVPGTVVTGAVPSRGLD